MLPEIGRRITPGYGKDNVAGEILIDGSGPLEVNGNIVYRDCVVYEIIFNYDRFMEEERAAVDTLKRLLLQLELLERWQAEPFPTSDEYSEFNFSGELVINGTLEDNVIIVGQAGRTEINGNVLNPIGPKGLLYLKQEGEMEINGNIFLGDAVIVHFFMEDDFEKMGVTAEPKSLSLESLRRRVDELERKVVNIGETADSGAQSSVESGGRTPPDSVFVSTEIGSERETDNFNISVRSQGESFTIQSEDAYRRESSMVRPAFEILQAGELQEFLENLNAVRGDRYVAEAAGEMLRQWLFPPDIWLHFIDAREEALRLGRNLRIRLNLEPPEIEMLPWEFCFDRSLGFLALLKDVAIVRYVYVPFVADQTLGLEPFRVLVISAAPAQIGLVDIQKELDNLDRHLRPFVENRELELMNVVTGTLDEFQNSLERFRPHIVHFFGFGDYDLLNGKSRILFNAEGGTPDRVPSEMIANLLSRTDVRLLVLNGLTAAERTDINPFMKIGSELVRAGLPAVIAMPYTMPYSSVGRFYESIYRGVLAGLPVDRMVKESRVNLFESADSISWGIPVLFTRAVDGVLWYNKENVQYPS
jgi:hypothetical protein